MMRFKSRPWFCAGLLIFAGLKAGAKPRYGYNARLLARHARFAQNRMDSTSYLLNLDFTQKARWSRTLTGAFGFRGEFEGAYAGPHPRFDGDVSQDATLFLPKDTYLRYARRVFSIEAGYQTVIWGEAFGTAYADLINPKDYREWGADDLTELQVPLPMVNMQWIARKRSLQVLLLPVAEHHLLPLRGSPFYTLPSNVRLLRSQPDYGRADFGVKYGFRLGDADLSLLGLHAADRFPVYDAQISGGEVLMRPRFSELNSLGGTLTSDLGFMMLRTELVHHFDREVQEGGALFGQTTRSDEWVYVLGCDLTQFGSWQIGLQGSEFRLKDGNYLFRKADEKLSSIRIARDFENDSSIELLLSERLDEHSYLIQPKVTFPFTSRGRIVFGGDFFGGDAGTSWGDLKNASRLYIKLIGYLKG